MFYTFYMAKALWKDLHNAFAFLGDVEVFGAACFLHEGAEFDFPGGERRDRREHAEARNEQPLHVTTP